MNKNTVIRQDVKTLRRIRLNVSTSPRLHEKEHTMKIKPFIIFLALLLPIAVLSAQPLSLDSCKSMALRNNATVKNAALDVLVARQVRQQVLTKYFPNVSALAGGYYALNPLVEFGIDDIGNAEARQWLHNMYAEYGAALGLPNSLSMCEKGYTVGVTAVQPVFMGGQIVNGSRLAKLGEEAATLQQELTCDKLLQQVEETYWLVVSLQDKKQTIEQAMVFLDTLDRDVTAAFNAGLVTQNDKLKVTEVNIRHMAYTGVMTRVGFDLISDTMTIMEDGNANRIVRDQYHHYDKPYIFLRDVDVEPIVLESEEVFENMKG